jgi:hypothetical protein
MHENRKQDDDRERNAEKLTLLRKVVTAKQLRRQRVPGVFAKGLSLARSILMRSA